MSDAIAQLEEIRERKRDLRRVAYRRSKLRPWRAELVELRRAGASYGELAEWLRKYKRRRVAPSTIHRYLTQLPEMQE